MSNLAYMPRYTYEDYKLWEGDWELIDGYPVAMAPSPFGPHQAIMSKIVFQLEQAFEKCENPKSRCIVYAELDYVIDEHTVVRPDVMVSCKKIIDFARTAPKFIAEITSPSTAQKDERVKFELYEREGVEWYMIVSPELKKVRLFWLEGRKYQKAGEAIDGEIKLTIEGCEIVFMVDRFWEVL